MNVHYLVFKRFLTTELTIITMDNGTYNGYTRPNLIHSFTIFVCLSLLTLISCLRFWTMITLNCTCPNTHTNWHSFWLHLQQLSISWHSGEENQEGTICWTGFSLFPSPCPAERQYVYSFTLRECGHRKKQPSALSSHVVMYVFGLLFDLPYCSHCVFPCHTNTLFKHCVLVRHLHSWSHSAISMSVTVSIRAIDLFAFGSGSSDLNKHALSQEVILYAYCWPLTILY